MREHDLKGLSKCMFSWIWLPVLKQFVMVFLTSYYSAKEYNRLHMCAYAHAHMRRQYEIVECKHTYIV